ncbi:hypothetical protein [Streptomyces kaniharaensis]|uniref:hypothetical protein n=1 Tax=Streptomyces kaniharaensis TaxID=212423 RepID=UPI0018A870F2|nr:hypothetical protein [Streptomyces kaniharaensis]
MSPLPSRVTGDPLRLVLVLIGVVTVLTGLVQLVVPGAVLDVLSAESTPTGRHLFATVGMFMIVIGGLVVQGLLSPAPPSYLPLWVGLQKFAASVLVAVAVARDLFGPVALLVAAFDFATAILCALMWRRLLIHRAGAPAVPTEEPAATKERT